MLFEVRTTYYPRPIEPDDYIRPHEIDVVCCTTDDDNVVAARLAVDYLDFSRVMDEEADLYEVCDADSAGWEDVYKATIELGPFGPDAKEEFGLTDSINGLVFIHKAVFHPEIRDWEQFILDSVCTMFPEDTATVMWRGMTNLTDKELASLGFRIIAGKDLIFRPNMLSHEYSAADDSRDPLDLQVSSHSSGLVECQWKPSTCQTSDDDQGE